MSVQEQQKFVMQRNESDETEAVQTPSSILLSFCHALLVAVIYYWTIHKHGAPWAWLFPITVPPSACRELVGTPARETPLTHVKYRAVAQLSWQEKSEKKLASIALSCPGSFLSSLDATLPSQLLKQTPVLCSSQCSPGYRHQNWTCESGLNLTKMSNSSRKVLHFCVHAWPLFCLDTFPISPSDHWGEQNAVLYIK